MRQEVRQAVRQEGVMQPVCSCLEFIIFPWVYNVQIGASVRCRHVCLIILMCVCGRVLCHLYLHVHAHFQASACQQKHTQTHRHTHARRDRQRQGDKQVVFTRRTIHLCRETRADSQRQTWRHQLTWGNVPRVDLSSPEYNTSTWVPARDGPTNHGCCCCCCGRVFASRFQNNGTLWVVLSVLCMPGTQYYLYIYLYLSICERDHHHQPLLDHLSKH